ncbi:hypothetical protein OAF33_00695 [bacterium]|nr:hypothetical protein [bacterium]
MSRLLFSVFLFVLIASSGISTALTLNEIEVVFRSEILKVNETRDSSAAKLRDNYQKALIGLQKSYQESKDLKRALLVKKEIENVLGKQWPLAPLAPELASKAAKLRKIFLKEFIEIEHKWGLETSHLAGRMEKLLTKERDDLTKAGKLEEALKVETRIKALSENPEIIRARELPKRLSKSGQGRAAFVMRRCGDNIEVLVRFDNAGKLSWKSPIENIIEKTGGGKERGKTQAKTLGEFMGAKGFSTFPYTAFDESVQSGKLNFTELYGVTREKKLNQLDQDGVGFSIKPGVKNAYLTLAGVMASTSGPATHRITCEYLIPETNRKLAGFNFRHGASKDGVSLLPSCSKKGKWTSQIVEGVSGSLSDLLRVHFAIPTFDDYPLAGGDLIILRLLKIEYIRFSGFVVEAFDENGVPSTQDYEQASQKMMIQNGSFIPESK